MMVMWWHPTIDVVYTRSADRARRWYGDDYLDYAIVCDMRFDVRDWLKRQVVR